MICSDGRGRKTARGLFVDSAAPGRRAERRHAALQKCWKIDAASCPIEVLLSNTHTHTTETLKKKQQTYMALSELNPQDGCFEFKRAQSFATAVIIVSLICLFRRSWKNCAQCQCLLEDFPRAVAHSSCTVLTATAVIHSELLMLQTLPVDIKEAATAVLWHCVAPIQCLSNQISFGLDAHEADTLPISVMLMRRSPLYSSTAFKTNSGIQSVIFKDVSRRLEGRSFQKSSEGRSYQRPEPRCS